MIKEQLWHVDIGYACFGITTAEGIVIDAPPIAQWMIGKSKEVVFKWIKNKKPGTIKCCS